MNTPPPLPATKCVTIFMLDNQHSRFQVYHITQILDKLEGEQNKHDFKQLTSKPLSDDVRRTPWRGKMDPRFPKTISVFYVFNRVEECKFKK
jgi:hypothetical protein